MQKLSAKQEQFCREYLVDLNATQAAIRAGYSPKTARSQGQRLLTNVDVQEFVQAAKTERADKVARTAQDVLNDIIAVTSQARDEGDLKTALKGLELQGKHLGMFTDKIQQEVSGPNGGPVQASSEIVVRFVEATHGD
jgi:phage terminase small subunit